MLLLLTPPWPDETLICLTSSWELNRTPLLPYVQDPYIFLHCSQIQHLSRQNRILPTSKARDSPSLGRKVAFTLMSVRTSVQISESQTALLGRILGTGDSTRGARPKPPTTHRDQPRASSPINDNHCVKGLQEGLLARSKTVSQELLTDSVNYGFYYATKAYHVGLNAVLGLPHPGPTS